MYRYDLYRLIRYISRDSSCVNPPLYSCAKTYEATKKKKEKERKGREGVDTFDKSIEDFEIEIDDAEETREGGGVVREFVRVRNFATRARARFSRGGRIAWNSNARRLCAARYEIVSR